MNEALINDYLARLQAARGDEAAFPALYAELDDVLNADEAKRLCKLFAHATARTKAVALHHIWWGHYNLIDARLRAAHNAGRIAG